MTTLVPLRKRSGTNYLDKPFGPRNLIDKTNFTPRQSICPTIYTCEEGWEKSWENTLAPPELIRLKSRRGARK